MTANATVLAAEGLEKTFGTSVRAVQGVSLHVDQGETLGVVGESGSGKSTTIRLLLGLEKPDAGRIYLDGYDVTTRSRTQERHFRRSVQLVPQNPQTSFNPRMSIEASLHFALSPHLRTRTARTARIQELAELVALPSRHLHKHPHELSGGQLQRAAIARALGPQPRLLVCDEAVSALDKSVQAQVLNLLTTSQRELHLAMLFISHDMSVIEHVSDRVIVMNGGQVLEQGTTSDVYRRPQHPYTQTLLDSVLA